MGTKSLTIFKEGKQEICVLYRQMDGYPEGHGKELAEFLVGMRIVNGFGALPDKQANGMGCLAAQVVAHFKDGVGMFYLYPKGTRDIGEEYSYTISGEAGDAEPTIEVKECYGPVKKLFKGPVSLMLEFLANAERE